MEFVNLEELKLAVRNYLDENNTIPYPDIRDWDILEVDCMNELFKDLIDSDEKNERIAGISEWDVSNVWNMESMFEGCSHFNQPLDNWDVSTVEYMRSMFKGCTHFNQYLGSWKVDNVSDMESMFEGCVSFDRPLNRWARRTENLTNLKRMFYNCPRFPRYTIQSWECFKEPYAEEDNPSDDEDNQSDDEVNLRIKINDIFGPTPVNATLGMFYEISQYHNLIVPNNLPNETIDNSILERTIYDPIMLQDFTVRDYLNENLNAPNDEKHIVFVKQDENNPNNVNVVGITRNDLKTIIHDNEGSAVRYACLNVGESLHITPLMIKYFPLFANRFIGLHGGLTMLADLKYVIMHPEITMVKLVENRRESPAVATASLNMLSTFANAVSAAHCQAGTGERIYNLVNISSVTGETSRGKRKSRHTKKQKKSNKRKTKRAKRSKK
jgi:surface protein